MNEKDIYGMDSNELLENERPKDVKENDPINPNHYKGDPSGIECIQVTECMGFCPGNVVKYLWRADWKPCLEEKLQDLKKARWYLDRINPKNVATSDPGPNPYNLVCNVIIHRPFPTGYVIREVVEMESQVDQEHIRERKSEALYFLDKQIENVVEMMRSRRGTS